MLRRLLLVDRNDDFLDGLRSLLEHEPGTEVVGRAHSASEAIARARRLRPHLVLMDVALSDMSGFKAVAKLKALPSAPRVVLMTFHGSRAAREAAHEAGADGCVSKADAPDRLLLTLQEILWAEPASGKLAAGGSPI